MRVLFAATELAPFVKVGGLGDFAGSLPKALRRLGIDARVVMPAHAGVLRHAPETTSVARFSIGHRDGAMRAEVLQTELAGVPTYLVTGPPIAADGIVYTGRMDEEGRRFAFFSLAVVDLIHHLEWKPDVLHANDWHTALTPWILRERRMADDALRPIGSVLTIHNLPYAGHGAEDELHAFGITGTDDPRVPPELHATPMAHGLVAADQLVAVSEGYAKEILTPELGAGFHELLRARRPALSGILNGLDTEDWDPSLDAALDQHFSATDREAREPNREALSRELELEGDAPLVAFVGRLVGQKGVDLMIDALRQLREQRWRAVLLGTGDDNLERAALELAAEMPSRVAARIAFDERLARRIYAGADLLLVPSRYEPCGMAQMIAMRYGSVPVARETGGLADTVRDLDLSDRSTGVLFPEATAGSLAFAIRRGLALHARRERFDAVVAQGMDEDFSWARSAAAYARLYERIHEARGAAKRAEGGA